MGTVISVTSGKGGTGKSTFTVNCGAALALSGKTVLLVDADAGLRSLDIMLRVSDQVVYDLADILQGRCEPAKAIVKTPWNRLSMIPAPAADEETGCADALQKLCRGLCQYYDFILLDSPAGMGTWAKATAAAADLAILVVTPDPVCIRDADRMAGRVLSGLVPEIRLVINRVQPQLLRKKLDGGLDVIIDAAAVQLLGVVPEDRRIALAAYDGDPIVHTPDAHGGAAEAYCNIARRLLGEDIPLMHF
ncbi:AAA family ATPase [Ethanoligenens harbinense]|uniref:Septum site-determining protein MinD n=1 Tax=Ethanoligenens harbinense (strain DSM 18485 / JCM 12961 / CGMCC 1.5033 / YUAN-3) TaxID=663278 RepID=E6U7E0_ETHHY|nr:AAA family ATPase [Ethanoligenens harbinense]ADU25875.1 septum site-determining protein MinD [Ethanoligenens harbinense YUAN-3]